MSLLTNLKLNYITTKLKQVENTTANADIVNAVIDYINDNQDKFDPTIDVTKLNAFVQKYLNDNQSLFRGQPGPAVSDADIMASLDTYIKSQSLITFNNVALTNLTNGNTTLQKYTPNIQDNEYDITTKNIKANKANLTGSLSIGNNLLNYFPSSNTSNNDLKTNVAEIEKLTCKEIHAKTGTVSDGTEKITFVDNVSFNSGLTTSALTTTNLDVRNLSNGGNGIICNETLTVGNNKITKNNAGSNNADLETNNLIVSNIGNKGNAININDAINTLTCKTVNGVLQVWDPNSSFPDYPFKKVGTIFNNDIKFLEPIRVSNINPLSSNLSIGSVATDSTTIVGNFSIFNKFIGSSPCILDSDITITGNLNCGSITSRTLYNVNTTEDQYFNNLPTDFSWINKIHILGVNSEVILPSIFNVGQFGTPRVAFGSYVGFIRNRPPTGNSVLSTNFSISYPRSFDGSIITDSIPAGQIAIYIVLGQGYAKMFNY